MPDDSVVALPPLALDSLTGYSIDTSPILTPVTTVYATLSSPQLFIITTETNIKGLKRNIPNAQQFALRTSISLLAI